MGTTSGGLPHIPYRMLLPTGKMMKLNVVPKKMVLTAFLAVVFCTVVLCKQDSRYIQDTKRLNFKLNNNDLYQNNNNHKILRPKRDVSSSGWSNMKSMHYCTWNAPLNKKYFTAYYEENREIHGCTSSEQTQSGVLVHAIHLNTTNRNVLLTIEDNSLTSSGIILLLYSVTPVYWRLSFNGDAYYSPTEEQESSYSRNVIISRGSTLKNYQDVHINVYKGDQLNSIFEDEQQFQTKKHIFDQSVIEKIRNTWGALTTFSRISSANRISITLPQDESLPQKCIIKSRNSGNETQSGISKVPVNNGLSSKGSVAYMITKQPATGCFHEEVAGTLEEDVHVIDLQSADDDFNGTSHKSKSNQKMIKSSTDETDDSLLPNVYLSLAPEGTENGPEVIQRDLTLILHSKQKVKWYLESIDLSGKLKVISTNGPVFNYELAGSQKLTIENNPLPAAFDQLWKAVVTKTNNNPISYARINKANVLTILVPNRPKQGSSLLPIDFKDDKATIIPDPKESYISIPTKTDKSEKESKRQSNVIQKIENHIRGFMTKTCNQLRTEILLPLDVTKHYNVVGVHLNEPECAGSKNSTHWILETKSTSCGSIGYFKGSHPMMQNNVVLKFASGSEYSDLEVLLPFECRFCSGIQMDAQASSDYNEEDCDDEEDTGLDSPVSLDDGDEMYDMNVSLVMDPSQSSNKPSNTRLLFKERYSPAQDIKAGDKIKVSTYFESTKAMSLISIAINQCWLDDHPATDRRTINDNNWLLYEGCPADQLLGYKTNNVTLLPPAQSNGFGPAFTFDITPRHTKEMRNIYIKCSIGLCSSIKGFGNFAECVDPITSCNERKRSSSGSKVDHVAPTAQQLILRGPLRVIQPIGKTHPKSPPTQSSEIDLSPKVLSDFSNNKSPRSDSNKYEETVVSNENGKPPMHHSHAVMVGVPLEIAIAVALASFVIGAALTGVLCCIHHKKSTPKHGAWRNGDELDQCTERSELQSMIASPHHHNHHITLQSTQHNGGAITRT